MSFLVASEPQLAVVHGLVTARTQVCKNGKQFLTKRCSPVSYGVVSRQRYNPQVHQGQPTVRDEHQGTTVAIDQITWLVKRGEVLDLNKGASQMYQMHLAVGEEKLPWHTVIAMSTAEADNLPRNVKDDTARIVCRVEFELDARHFKLKNSKWYQLKQPYYKGQLEVRLLLEVGLKFQVWQDGRLLSKEHDEIHVEWVPPGALPTALAAKDARRMLTTE